MAVKVDSSDISDAKLGTTKVQKMYIGSTEVWSSAPPTYPGNCDFFGDGTGWAYCTFNNTLSDSCGNISVYSSNKYGYTAGMVGNSLVMDTSGDGDSYLYYQKSGGGDCLHHYMYGTAVTYSLWVYAQNSPSSRFSISFAPNYLDMETAVIGGFDIDSNYTIFYRMEYESPDTIQIGSTGLAHNRWCHLVATKQDNSTIVYIYLDGSYTTNVTLSQRDYSGYGIQIGIGDTGYSACAPIRVDNARILTKYCTSDDVQALYNER